MARSLDRKLRLVIERRFKRGSPTCGATMQLDCGLDAVLVSLLDSIRGLIGLLYQALRSEGVIGIRGDAEGGGNACLEPGVPQEDVALDGAADALGDDEGARRRGLRQHDLELVP